uniref:UxaA family hydrolase n=1 Tax=Desertihabitans aurantiacus TaxID=2282477 RepID=UPI0018E53376
MSTAAAPTEDVRTDPTLLLLSEEDDVAVALADLVAGQQVDVAGGSLTVTADVPRGHKVALRAVPAGQDVRKYGQVIGRATADIVPGAHVHTHNLSMSDTERQHEFGVARWRPPAPTGERPTFQGYRRADGRVGTRNYIGVVTSVNCSATAAKLIAEQFRGMALDAFENVDGVVALTHQSGCGLVSGSEGADVLLRTIRGYATHPNIGGLVLLGLGCEMLELDLISADL